MKHLIKSFFYLSLVLVASAETIAFKYQYNLEDYKGETYLSFMEKVIKPALDVVAVEGYVMAGPEAVEKAYNLSDTKVRNKVNRKWGGLEKVKALASALEGEVVSLATLPTRLRAVDRNVSDPYNLATFLGLASGGGVSIKYYEGNYGLNVHYDLTEERSGRSFGVGPNRLANDASDKDYLTDLQKYSADTPTNLQNFYRTLMQAVLNNDPTQYATVAPDGQTVLSDFLAVFTAEQARNLMDGEVSPHWDAALLEVTLLASFHAGQDEFKLYYKNPETQVVSFTAQTSKQTPCEISTRTQPASLRDYWQFSRNVTNPEHCNRSGINITKAEFRLLGKKITAYTKLHNPALYSQVKNSLELSGNPQNLLHALSKYLISSGAARALPAQKVQELSRAWGELLEYVRAEANNISAAIEANNL